VNLVFANPTGAEQTVQTELPWGNGIDKHVAGTPYDEKTKASPPPRRAWWR